MYHNALELGNQAHFYNLGQYKMEQLSPIPPKAMVKVQRSKKRAILASLKWGEGWSRCSIYFVQDCRLDGYKARLLIAKRSKLENVAFVERTCYFIGNKYQFFIPELCHDLQHSALR